MDSVIHKWRTILDEERALKRASRESSASKVRQASEKSSEFQQAAPSDERQPKPLKSALKDSGKRIQKPSGETKKVFQEDIPTQDHKTLRKTERMGQPSGITQEAIIDKVSRVVLEVARQDRSDEERLQIVKSIMIDLYAPSLTLIEELEEKIRQLQTGAVAGDQKYHSKRIPTSDSLIIALENRVQELTATNCNLEARLSATTRELETLRQNISTPVHSDPPHQTSLCGSSQ